MKAGHPKRKFIFQPSIFRCLPAASFREGNFGMISKSMRFRRLCCVWRDIPDWCAFPPNQIHQNHPQVTKKMLAWMRFLWKNQLKLISANPLKMWKLLVDWIPKLSDSRLRTFISHLRWHVETTHQDTDMIFVNISCYPGVFWTLGPSQGDSGARNPKSRNRDDVITLRSDLTFPNFRPVKRWSLGIHQFKDF